MGVCAVAIVATVATVDYCCFKASCYHYYYCIHYTACPISI
jgi:hypothetical protein